MSAVEAITAVLWDMDGTLIDSEPLHFRSMVSVLDGLGVRTYPELQGRLMGMGAPDVYEFCRSEFSLELTESEWTRRRTVFYLDGAMSLVARPGALEAFRKLDRLGIAQAIVSNSDRVIVDANLRALGLDEEKLVSVSRSDVVNAKPHPDSYLLAARRLKVPVDACVVVEDSIPGARAGRAAGMRVFYWPQDNRGVTEESLSGRSDDNPIDRELGLLPGIRLV